MRVTLEQIADKIQGKLWQDHGKTRIYFKSGRKDTKVFINIELIGGDVSGSSLEVYVDRGSQNYNWVQSQKELVKKSFKAQYAAFIYLTESHLNYAEQPESDEYISMSRMADIGKEWLEDQEFQEQWKDKKSEVKK